MRRITTLLLTFALFLPSLRAEEKESAKLAEVRQRLSDTLNSIRSYHIEFELNFSPSPDWRSEVYARRGDLWYSAEIYNDPPYFQPRQSVRCYNGNCVFLYNLKGDPQEPKSWQKVRVVDKAPLPFITPDWLFGGNIPCVERSALQVAAFKTAKSEVTNNGQDIILRANSIPVPNPDHQGTFDVQLTLDPEHDYLPREIRAVVSPETPKGKNSTWLYHMTLSEFKKVWDDSANRERWFPMQGVLKQSLVPDKQPPVTTITFRVKRVDLNRKLTDDFFTPAIPRTVFVDTLWLSPGKEPFPKKNPVPPK